jgi:hypothetical protein
MVQTKSLAIFDVASKRPASSSPYASNKHTANLLQENFWGIFPQHQFFGEIFHAKKFYASASASTCSYLGPPSCSYRS